MINTIDARTSADQILRLERGALDRWGKGDPGGFLELYAADITYFDPVTATRIDGHQAMVNYYRPWVGKIQIARYEMLNPQVVVDDNMALLTYNLATGGVRRGWAVGVGSREELVIRRWPVASFGKWLQHQASQQQRRTRKSKLEPAV